jgi:hypothetical protein
MSATLRSAIVLATAGFAAADLRAQPFYADVTATHLPDGIEGRCMNAAAGDVDGDGDLDLALAMEFEPKVLLVNDGAGRFRNASAQLPRAVHDSEDVSFADFDGDGDLDLVLVSEDDRKDELYFNDGEGFFTDVSERLGPNDVSNALVVLDLNGDGAPDVLTGNIGTDRLLLNDRSGRFRDETATRWRQGSAESRTQDLEAFDADGDGDLDVANVRFVLDEPPRDKLLLNDGRGYFSLSPADSLPAAGDESNFTIQAVDLDDDGDMDVLAPNTVFGEAAGDYRVLLNDGRARFTVAAPGTVLPPAVAGNGFGIEVADFDGDGRDDLFFCNRASTANAATSGGVQRLLLRR